MTTVVCWKSVDYAGRETLQFCSDSRFADSSGNKWDCGRKLFCSDRFPDVFGFVGEALPPQTALGQLVDAIDSSSIASRSLHPSLRMTNYKSYLDRTVGSYPRTAPIEILYATRGDDQSPTSFHLWNIRYDAGSKLGKPLSVQTGGEKSRLIQAFGSGKAGFLARYKEVRSGSQGSTSRAVYWAFVDHLESGLDRYTGGAPQIVRLGSSGAAFPVGISHNGERFLFGFQLDASDLSETQIKDWHDEKYQFVEPVSGKLRSKAQRIGRD